MAHICVISLFTIFFTGKIATKKNAKVGFIHIPAVPEQVIKYWSESPFMPIEMSCQATEAIVEKQIQLIG